MCAAVFKKQYCRPKGMSQRDIAPGPSHSRQFIVPGPASLMMRQIVQPLTISSLLSFRPPSLATMGTVRYTARKFGDLLQEFVLAAEELILMVQRFQNIRILA